MKKITLFIVLLISVWANAQWATDTAANTLVANSTPTGSQSIGTSTGETYVVFWKSVEAPVNFELRVQLLDENGMQQFGPDGMLISNSIPMSTYTSIWKVAIDGKNNLYVSVTGTGTGTPGMIYKINTQGQSLWPDGINVGAGYLPTVLPLDEEGNDDIIVSYFPGSGRGKLQRYSAAGTPVWANAVEIMPSATYSTRSTITADMYKHANGEFTVVFHTKLSFGVASLVFAQRYSGDGVALWAAPTQLADMQTAYNALYSGTQDGDIVYYAYSLSHDSRFDSYVQRINADGTTPWGINGIDFDTNQTNFEMNTSIAFSPGSQFVWAIARYTTSSQGQNGEYVQKFDKVTGARQFTDNAKQVFPIDDNHRSHLGSLHLVSDQPVFITNLGMNNGASPTTINAVFLDGSGDFILEDDTQPVATFATAKGNVYLNKPVNNQSVLTFSETKTDGQNKIYAQNFFMPADLCSITPEAIPAFEAACQVEFTDLTAPAFIDDCGNEVIPTTDETLFPISQGTTTITWTYTTSTGFIAEQTQDIIVNDATAPTLILQNISVEIGEEGSVAVTADQFNNGSTDECSGDISTWTWTISPESFNCDNLGDQTVTITATDANGNTATSTATVTIQDPEGYCTAGVSDYDAQSFAMYPNPVNDALYIRSMAGTAINSVKVYSILGQELYNTLNTTAAEQLTIPFSNFGTGSYIISVETASGIYTKQIIKTK